MTYSFLRTIVGEKIEILKRSSQQCNLYFSRDKSTLYVVGMKWWDTLAMWPKTPVSTYQTGIKTA